MQMTGEQRIAAPRQRVWEALNDPAVLARCIPGCQGLERDGDDRFLAVAEVKIGPIGARFKGQVQLADIDAPNGYTITGSGNGGIAGSAKGRAKVRLADVPGGGTLVSYAVEAEVGGRMAQLGGPIIDATARNLAGRFFQTFGEMVGGGDHAPAAVPPPAAAAPVQTAQPVPQASPPPLAGQRAPLWGWVAALVAALLAGFTLGVRHVHSEMLIVLVLLVLTAAAAYEAGRRGGGR